MNMRRLDARQRARLPAAGIALFGMALGILVIGIPIREANQLVMLLGSLSVGASVFPAVVGSFPENWIRVRRRRLGAGPARWVMGWLIIAWLLLALVAIAADLSLSVVVLGAGALAVTPLGFLAAASRASETVR